MSGSLVNEIVGIDSSRLSTSRVLDEVPIGIVILDSKQNILFVNRTLESLIGFGCEESYGIPCSYMLKCNHCFHGCPLKQLSLENRSVTTESNIINRNREKIPVRITSSLLLDQDDEVLGFIETFEDVRVLESECTKVERVLKLDDMIGRSPQIQRVFQMLPVIAQTDSSVLITGQTGTGKDLLAEAIHKASVRAKGPFVKVNCGALPETLLESELFGHQKGAFTGAVENRLGRFRLAHNGTLLLTEIGDLPLTLQVKLLSFLDDKVVYPLGSSKGVHVDVRVIAATNRNLEEMVRQGRFRRDLLFRLNVIRLELPPLCERKEDISTLLDHFLRIMSLRFKNRIKSFSPEARDILLSFRYPGNVRELRNIVEYCVNVCEGDTIEVSHLPAYLMEKQDSGIFDSAPASKDDDESEPVAVFKLDYPNWRAAEKKMIFEAMIKAKGSRSKAAAILGWGRSTLWRKMKRLGIE
ncbi:MAG: sigma 54-interacting transcriptional regulator [Syntrophaceae bacterium]|nr:sigma 54-interacting transcriptional regulator [Syntrophaceae bacterium]